MDLLCLTLPHPTCRLSQDTELEVELARAAVDLPGNALAGLTQALRDVRQASRDRNPEAARAAMDAEVWSRLPGDKVAEQRRVMLEKLVTSTASPELGMVVGQELRQREQDIRELARQKQAAKEAADRQLADQKTAAARELEAAKAAAAKDLAGQKTAAAQELEAAKAAAAKDLADQKTAAAQELEAAREKVRLDSSVSGMEQGLRFLTTKRCAVGICASRSVTPVDSPCRLRVPWSPHCVMNGWKLGGRLDLSADAFGALDAEGIQRLATLCGPELDALFFRAPTRAPDPRPSEWTLSVCIGLKTSPECLNVSVTFVCRFCWTLPSRFKVQPTFIAC
jgi:hypothetical protein